MVPSTRSYLCIGSSILSHYTLVSCLSTAPYIYICMTSYSYCLSTDYSKVKIRQSKIRCNYITHRDHMASSQLPEWKTTVSYLLKHGEAEDEEKEKSTLPVIPQPETPSEPIEFLARSWSLSANEISKALATKHMEPAFDNNLYAIPEAAVHPFPNNSVMQSGKVTKHAHGRTRAGAAIGKFFHHHKEHHSGHIEKKKDKARVENAHMHAVLSVAGVAAALAAATATTETSKSSCSKMNMALASATELLASYCVELAESAGAEHERVSSVVRSAVGIRTASDLLTLTAAAATALRGEAALKARLPKEAKKSASISPCEKGIVDPHSLDLFHHEVEEEELPCVGDLLQITQKGVLRWKHVSVYINKKHQVKIKLKSKHVGGAFSKKNKCIVYEVIGESGGWPFRKERDNIDVYFGVKTSRGLMEFKCKNKVHRQNWVDEIEKLLQRKSCIEEAENSLRMLSVSQSI